MGSPSWLILFSLLSLSLRFPLPSLSLKTASSGIILICHCFTGHHGVLTGLQLPFLLALGCLVFLSPHSLWRCISIHSLNIVFGSFDIPFL